jgi:hypothetical protein
MKQTTSFNATGSTGLASFKDYRLKTIWDKYEDKEIQLNAKRQNRKMTLGIVGSEIHSQRTIQN